MGEELGAALDLEVTIEGRHVLMRGGVAHAEPSGDLLLAVSLQQASEGLAKSWREPVRARFGRAHQRAADETPELAVKEVEQPLLARREVPLAARPLERDHADGPVARDLAHRHESMVGIILAEILVEGGGAVVVDVGNELPPSAGDEWTGDLLQSAEHGIAGRPEIAHEGHQHSA